MNRATDQRYVLLGAGGHAAVLLEALAAAGETPPIAVFDADPTLHGTKFYGISIEGGDELFSHLGQRGITRFVLGIGSVDDTRLRRQLYRRALDHGLEPVAVRHPSAMSSSSARFGRGLQLLAGSIVNTEARLGENVLVNTVAVVEHHCVVGDHVHLATGCILSGGVAVSDGAHIGAGAIVKQGITVGRNAVVGAGAVVVRDVPDHAVVAGVPARTLRFLSPSE